MKLASIVSATESSGFVVFDYSPAHLFVLVAAVVLLALSVVVVVALWREGDRSLLEKVVWSTIVLIVPVFGPIVVGAAIVWRRRRDARSR